MSSLNVSEVIKIDATAQSVLVSTPESLTFFCRVCGGAQQVVRFEEPRPWERDPLPCRCHEPRVNPARALEEVQHLREAMMFLHRYAGGDVSPEGTAATERVMGIWDALTNLSASLGDQGA